MAAFSQSVGVSVIPESFRASRAAMSANWENRSRERVRFASKCWPGSYREIWAPFRNRSFEVSTESIARIPDLPWLTAFQVSARLLPKAQITPMPVTATRRACAVMACSQAWPRSGKHSPSGSPHSLVETACPDDGGYLNFLSELPFVIPIQLELAHCFCSSSFCCRATCHCANCSAA